MSSHEACFFNRLILDFDSNQYKSPFLKHSHLKTNKTILSHDIHQSGVGKIKKIKMFLKEVFYAHQGCIYLIKNTLKILCNIMTFY